LWITDGKASQGKLLRARWRRWGCCQVLQIWSKNPKPKTKRKKGELNPFR